MNKVLVAGAGGFIGGHLVKKLIDEKYEVTAVDIKPLDLWFQKFDNVKNYSFDLKNINHCNEMVEGNDEIFNMACNMGGMGFIENNKAECMLSVLINTNLLMASKKYKVKKYFFSSSACAYNINHQQNTFIQGLREEDAYPAMPEDGYGWEKLFSERMCRHFYEDFGVDVSIARYHNVYGPMGTFDGGREKAPAALTRKIIHSQLNNENSIDIWGDGEQSRSFLYVDDCIEGTLKLFNTEYREPLNIGSEEQVSINQMVSILEQIAQIKNLKRIYQLDKPKGVRGRSSNNDKLKSTLNWNYEISLREGLEKLYIWMKEIIQSDKDIKKFS